MPLPKIISPYSYRIRPWINEKEFKSATISKVLGTAFLPDGKRGSF